MNRWMTAALVLGMGCADQKAPEKCQDLVDTLCDNTEEACVPAIDAEECADVAKDAGMDCDNAADVSDSYDTCLAELADSEGCVVLEGLPKSCEGVILLVE